MIELDRGKELRWTTLHPEHWTVNEVSSWVEYVCKEHQIEAKETAALVTAFDDVNGPRLLHMTKQEFLLLTSEYGNLLFGVFHKMVNSVPQDQATIPLDQQSSSSFTGEIGGNGSHEDKQDLAKTSTYDTSVQTSQNQPRQSD